MLSVVDRVSNTQNTGSNNRNTKNIDQKVKSEAKVGVLVKTQTGKLGWKLFTSIPSPGFHRFARPNSKR